MASQKVLQIYPYWNVNITNRHVAIIDLDPSNLSILECKCVMQSGRITPFLLQIYPYWNVNMRATSDLTSL